MFNGHGLAKSCSVLAVLCGNFADREEEDVKDSASYPFKDLVSSGRLEVHTLVNPSISKFREVQNSTTPNILYLQGEKFVDEDEIGSLVWAGVDVSEPEELCSHIGPSLPTAAYLEFQDSEKASEALYAKGIPYVIYWKSGFPSYSASHFRHAFFSVVQSSSSHIWDAFQLAHASFRFYCVNNSNNYPVNTCKVSGKAVPCMLGEAPKCSIPPEEKVSNDEEESLSDIVPAISIYDGGVDTAFLVCGMPSKLDTTLDPLEDGINALLRIEIRGSKLHNRVSATPPPSLQTGGFSSGVVTMRCDLTTCSSAHISLLVSGSPQILFDDQLLEIYIKNELTEKSQLVHAMPSSEENKTCFVEPRRSSSIACGASVFEVCMKIPIWATQILKQLAPDVSYRSLVALGIASIQGSSVSSFEKEDAERLLFFCNEQASLDTQDCTSLSPCWFKIPAPSSSPVVDQEMNLWSPGMTDINVRNDKRGRDFHPVPVRHRLKISAMRPVPHKRQHKMMPFAGTPEHEINNNGFLKPNLPPLSYKKHTTSAPVSRRKSQSSSGSQQITTLNPLPLRKHGCDRSPIRDCTEEEFLTDVMEFLILRGHNRLIPEGGVSEFPDVILNAKRLDLYNLYREVVSRGGFHVGNGINWKGQVFSKMRNHTLSNRMTGVGNSLKRHYETYLLEYELAHDDVDGEFCLLCHSSAPGDWVNCGLCGEWAHFGCDRRQGLGAFKDYAKTDGLEYICPQCSIATAKRKSLKVGE